MPVNSIYYAIFVYLKKVDTLFTLFGKQHTPIMFLKQIEIVYKSDNNDSRIY